MPSPTPLVHDGEPMPMTTFNRLYRRPGYVYEYVEGQAKISVSESALVTVVARTADLLPGADAASRLPAEGELFSIGPTDHPSEVDGCKVRDRLVEAWVDVFAHTPDYHGYPIRWIRRDAERHVEALMDAPESLATRASCVAWVDNRPRAALLLSPTTTRPCIDAVFVHRALRRRGLASRMIQSAAGALHADGESCLCSRYLLANQASATWHAALGFREMPGWLVARHRHQCARVNARNGNVDDVYGAMQYADALEEKAAALRAQWEEDDDAASPERWLQDAGHHIDAFVSTQWADEDAVP